VFVERLAEQEYKPRQTELSAGKGKETIAIMIPVTGTVVGLLSRYTKRSVLGGRQASWTSSNSSTVRFISKMSPEERDAAVNHANQAMKGYVETRILAKQGKLKSKGRGPSEQYKSANAIQVSLLISLGLAFLISPILGRKIAQDEEFREKYVPDWYDFRVKPPKSAWTREDLHHQIIEVERDMRERAIRGEFTPEKLAELKASLQPRSDLSQEDVAMAIKYGWGAIHPGIDPDDIDDDEE